MAGGETYSREHVFGIILLLGAAMSYTMHMTGIRHWNFHWKEVLVTVPVVNIILFVPLWFLFPSALFKASLPDIAMQAFYQGVVVSILALMFVAYSVRHLGLVTLSMYISFVPVVTAFFAWVFLGEYLNNMELLGIAGCTLGLFLYALGWPFTRAGSVREKSTS
jgi:drug/metabolite transporter (DMT)-like permease